MWGGSKNAHSIWSFERDLKPSVLATNDCEVISEAGDVT